MIIKQIDVFISSEFNLHTFKIPINFWWCDSQVWWFWGPVRCDREVSLRHPLLQCPRGHALYDQDGAIHYATYTASEQQVMTRGLHTGKLPDTLVKNSVC